MNARIREANTLSPAQRVWLGPSSSIAWGNPTVLLFGVALALIAAGVAGAYTGRLNSVAVIALNSLGLYLGFTVLHDAVHGVAHRYTGVNRVLGTVMGLLLTFTFPFFRAVHMRHHGRTNRRGADPDAILAILPPLLAPWLGGTLLYASYHVNYFRQRLWRSRAELIEVLASDLAYLGVLAAAIFGGWLQPLLVIWVVPLVITLHVLVYTFDYLPHYPHDSTARLLNARAYGGRLVALLHLNQNYHLIHHLWPSIPWFHYRQVFLGRADELRALGCRVGWSSDRQLAQRQFGGALSRQRGQRDAAGPDGALTAGKQAVHAAPPAHRGQRHLRKEPTESGR